MTRHQSSLPSQTTMFVVLFLFASSIRLTIGAEIQCPVGTLNEGWIVQQQTAFDNPLDCCGDRVRNWEFSDRDDSFNKLDTGCSMKKLLLGRYEVIQNIQPIFCSDSRDCGDRARNGQSMECCKEGFCMALATNGSSRCGSSVAFAYSNRKVEMDYEDPVAEFANKCSEQGMSTCASCEQQCSQASLPFIDDALLRGGSFK